MVRDIERPLAAELAQAVVARRERVEVQRHPAGAVLAEDVLRQRLHERFVQRFGIAQGQLEGDLARGRATLEGF